MSTEAIQNADIALSPQTSTYGVYIIVFSCFHLSICLSTETLEPVGTVTAVNMATIGNMP